MFLSWIWKSCVQIVVDSLYKDSATTKAAKTDRRVWWIGVGEANIIPFHAAGDHSPGCLDNTVSHVVSSYTPTVKALEFARERLAQSRRTMVTSVSDTAPRELCVVTMPHTPGLADLPGVASELSSIQNITTSTFSISSLLSPTATQVKEQLQSCHIFHFAGHGKADAIDPFQGCLVLQKYDESGAVLVPDLVSVGDISRLHSAHAQLAYLSACSTAENNASVLADEVIHLVSGFQVAGFAHVIGSMWPSVDQICADVARLFYQNFCVEDGGMDADGFAAYALQSAVLEIRKQWWMEPLAWAQYVHFGA
jgi:CHAT domain-containing protein